MGVTYTPFVKTPESGIAYLAGAKYSSVRKGSETIKDCTGFGSVERAEHALELWKGLGFKGAPASASAFFREQLGKMKRAGKIKAATNATANNLISSGFYGGWIETMQTGACRGPLYHYDVNAAYLWAGGQGLPGHIRPYMKGDKNYLAIAYIKSSLEDLPKTFEQQRARLEPCIVTSEDVIHYGLDVEILRGISWKDLDFSPDAVLYELAELPHWLFKKLTQSYWGVWAARKPVEAHKYDGGQIVKRWKIYNRFQNLVWAQIIISRIVRLVHMEARQGGRLVYVDSVLIDRRIPESEQPGGWKLEEEFPMGVFIRAPGVWDRMPDAGRRRVNYWYKHAGYCEI